MSLDKLRPESEHNVDISDLLCSLREMIIELKITNAYNCLGHDETIKEEDVHEN